MNGLLVQQSAKESDALTDRIVKTGTGEYTIRTSFKTKTIEEIGSNNFGGIQFLYNPSHTTKVLEHTGLKQSDFMTLEEGLRKEYELSKDFDWAKCANDYRNTRMDAYLEKHNL